MKIMDNGICRDMTAEEEQAFFDARKNQPESPEQNEEATIEDYESALTDLGVVTNGD